jgi:hypothetical protein
VAVENQEEDCLAGVLSQVGEEDYLVVVGYLVVALCQGEVGAE